MPYIQYEKRYQFTKIINDAINKLLVKKNDSEAEEILDIVDPGELNYLISSIIYRLWLIKNSYANANMLCGVLDDVKHEFRRRKVDIYEEKKIKEQSIC